MYMLGGQIACGAEIRTKKQRGKGAQHDPARGCCVVLCCAIMQCVHVGSGDK
jgi:hypothetical protein